MRPPRPATTHNKRASAFAVFGRSGETGPNNMRSLGTRFLMSKRVEPGNEVTGRFGGPGTLSETEPSMRAVIETQSVSC